MAMARDRDYKWYIVPDDARTNEAIAEWLNRNCQAAGSECVFFDNLGNEHRGWLADYQLISTLQKNAARMKLKFRVYGQEGFGKPRQYLLFNKKKKIAEVAKGLTIKKRT
jgi:hypothetical protein